MIQRPSPPYSLLKENKQLLVLALPLILNYFVEGCPNFINNAMIAHLGETELAAGAIINTAFTGALVFLYGILAAASTLISHHAGANEKKEIGNVIKDACYLGLICSVLLFLLLFYIGAILKWSGQSEALILLAQQYSHGLMFAVIPDFATMILWQFFIGLGRTTVTLISSLLYVPISIFANYVLMFGHFGFPKWGLFGIGLGTALGYTFLLLGMLAYLLFDPRYRAYFANIQWLSLGSWKINATKTAKTSSHLPALLKVGLPLGIIWGIDTTFLMFAAFFAGKFSTTLLAAQQVGVQAITLTFMLLSGLAQAISIRMGYTWGAKSYHLGKAIYLSGLSLSFIVTLCISTLFWFKPLWLIGVDFDVHAPQNKQLVLLASHFLYVFGAYQLLNSLRYALFAALRGMKDTYFPAICSFLCFYLIGIGGGYPLLFHWHGTMFDFWYLVIIALSLMVLALYWRLSSKLKEFTAL